MAKPQVQLEEQESIAQSRILFQQVMVDNEPTQQEVLERAQQLDIDDLSLARQSLTKELEPFWRPYMNRFGDIYYINLKERKAYIEHPIDMETKILYSKRHKTSIPKYRALELEEVSSSLQLIEDEIKKWKKAELFRSTQSIPTQLNIVYEESEQSNTQRQQSQQEQSSDEQYIQNLQKSQQENTRSRKSTPRQRKESFNRGYKKFPSSGNRQQDNQLFQNQSQIELTPDYERLLIEYEEQLKKQHQKEIQIYREVKHGNYLKKQQILRQTQKVKHQKHKFSLLAEFQTQIEEKNSKNLEKQTQKMVMGYQQKLSDFQKTLQNQRLVLQNLEQSAQQKHKFIQSLEEKMQRRLNQGKHLLQEEVRVEINQIHFLSKISQQNFKAREQFNKQSYKMIESKMNELIQRKGINTTRGQKIQASSLSAFYENIVKREFEKIDNLLLENEVGRQMRRRTKSIFGKKSAESQAYQSHIVFAQSSRLIEQKGKDKENNMNSENFVLQEKKPNTIEQIENDILKSNQNNKKYYQRRNRIFGTADFQNKPTKNLNPVSKINQILHKNIPVTAYYKIPATSAALDRKSMYLRMMKRIL